MSGRDRALSHILRNQKEIVQIPARDVAVDDRARHRIAEIGRFRFQEYSSVDPLLDDDKADLAVDLEIGYALFELGDLVFAAMFQLAVTDAVSEDNDFRRERAT